MEIGQRSRDRCHRGLASSGHREQLPSPNQQLERRHPLPGGCRHGGGYGIQRRTGEHPVRGGLPRVVPRQCRECCLRIFDWQCYRHSSYDGDHNSNRHRRHEHWRQHHHHLWHHGFFFGDRSLPRSDSAGPGRWICIARCSRLIYLNTSKAVAQEPRKCIVDEPSR